MILKNCPNCRIIPNGTKAKLKTFHKMIKIEKKLLTKEDESGRIKKLSRERGRRKTADEDVKKILKKISKRY